MTTAELAAFKAVYSTRGTNPIRRLFCWVFGHDIGFKERGNWYAPEVRMVEFSCTRCDFSVSIAKAELLKEGG
jgi:hypothetical protein